MLGLLNPTDRRGECLIERDKECGIAKEGFGSRCSDFYLGIIDNQYSPGLWTKGGGTEEVILSLRFKRVWVGGDTDSLSNVFVVLCFHFSTDTDHHSLSGSIS